MARKYEAIYILNPALGEEAVQATSEKIQALFESAATVEKIDV